MATTLSATTYNNYIDGRWAPSTSGATFENRNPANTDDLIGIFQSSTRKDVEAALDAADRAYRDWRLVPVGSEGYRTAEVTLGGVDTAALDGRTMEAKGVPGLYFIGEVVDVTGWLGGYNFQWAWSSGWAAGQAV